MIDPRYCTILRKRILIMKLFASTLIFLFAFQISSNKLPKFDQLALQGRDAAIETGKFHFYETKQIQNESRLHAAIF
jgi:hypothetical protein